MIDEVIKGRYFLIEKVGKGGMAEVFRAFMRGPHGFQKEVCIKRILGELCDNPGFEAMFLDEAKIAAMLNHANIVQVFDFDRDENGRLFIAMEYIDGVNLKSLMVRSRERGVPLEVSMVSAVAFAVLQALHHAWTKEVSGKMLRVVHRDLSPHNILISKDGQIKITDFGIAKAITSAVRTRAGVVKGKMMYMSPEQAAGRKTDNRSDLYSLGVILWEMLCGRRLFEKAFEEMRVITIAERMNISSPSQLRNDISEAFSSFVMSLLQMDPQKRPSSALEAIETLANTCSEPFSPVKIQKLLVELDLLSHTDSSHVEKTATTDATESLSPPGSGSTLKPLSTHSVFLKEKKGKEEKKKDKGKKHFLFFPLSNLSLIFTLLVISGVTGIIFSIVKLSPFYSKKLFACSVIQSGSACRVAYDNIKGVKILKKMEFSKNASDSLKLSLEPDSGKAKEKKLESYGGTGFLNVNAKPWSEVIIDGRNYGYTPLSRIKMKAGFHKLSLKNSKIGIEKNLVVKIIKEKETDVFEDLTK